MNDDYPTCQRTYITLRIYPERLDPEEVTTRLGIEPSDWQRQGEPLYPNSQRTKLATIHGWFLSSEGVIDSRDTRHHLDWLLIQLIPKAEVILALQTEGCRMDVSTYWLSKNGHGGPAISPTQMEQFARLNLEIWFDVYFGGE